MDQLLIINKALMKCGLPQAASLADCDWNANTVFESCTDECLRSYAWNFAQKLTSLSPGTAPTHGFTKSYALPEDCVRVIDVHGTSDLRSPKARYVIAGQDLLTQVTPCYLRYVSKSITVDKWPPDFADAVACRIAMEIAPLSAQTMSMSGALAQFYYTALANAQAADARESAERVPLDHNILLSRAGGGQENVGKRGG